MDAESNQFYPKRQFDLVHDPRNTFYTIGNMTYVYPPNVNRDLKSESIYETIVDELTEYYNKQHTIIEIVMYFGKSKKFARKNSRYRLDLGNANSGFTTFTSEKNIILIHRDEDCMKVLIHELIHAFDMNIGYGKVPMKCNAQEFQVILNEAYVESLALFWHCQFYARFNGVSFRAVLARHKKFRRDLAQKVATMIFVEKAQHETSNALCYYIFATQAFLKLKIHHLSGISQSDFKSMLSKRQALWKGILPSIQSLAAIPFCT